MAEAVSIWTVGRRKTATARVHLVTPGSGKFVINNLKADEYFGGGYGRQHATVLQPLKLLPQLPVIDVYANVSGGGMNGQSEAIRHGLSRALVKFDVSTRMALKREGFLTRDPRMVERKKPGQPKARKKFQWTKR